MLRLTYIISSICFGFYVVVLAPPVAVVVVAMDDADSLTITKTIYEIKALPDMEDKITNLNEKTEQTLKGITTQADTLMKEKEQIIELDDVITNKIERVEELVRIVNKRQLEQLLIKIKEIERLEVDRRELINKQKGGGAEILSSSSGTDNIEALKSGLEGIFHQDRIFTDSDMYVENWARKVLSDEKRNVVDPVHNATQQLREQQQLDPEVRKQLAAEKKQQKKKLAKKKKQQKAAAAAGGECISPERAAQEVQVAAVQFSQDGIGLYDHLQNPKTSIVHEMTSDTYNPSLYNDNDEEEEVEVVEIENKKRSSLLSRYVPEDWENYIVPESWIEYMKNADTFPPFLTHTFNNMFGSSSTIIMRSNVAPPEAVLDTRTLPGNCWPMDGRSGSITIRLPYRVNVNAISIDHAPTSLLVDDDATHKGQQATKRAARIFKVFGYNPCRTTDAECTGTGLGFDKKEKHFLSKILYKIDDGGIQTFEIDSSAEGVIKGGDSGGGATSCSAKPDGDADGGTCTGDGEDGDDNDAAGFAAIRFEISNYDGKADYTCIYRIRVHGEPI